MREHQSTVPTRPAVMAVARGVLIAFLVLAMGATTLALRAAAAGSDSPTPYTVDTAGITLPAGQSFPDNGHVNVRWTGGAAGLHFEGKCVTRTDAECAGGRHAAAQFIGRSFIPWSAFGVPADACVTWVQIAQFTEHFGEGGQAPVCLTEEEPCPTTTTPTTPTSEPTSPEPSSTPTPTSDPTPTPTESAPSSEPEPTPSESSTSPSETPASTDPTPTSPVQPPSGVPAGAQPAAAVSPTPQPEHTSEVSAVTDDDGHDELAATGSSPILIGWLIVGLIALGAFLFFVGRRDPR